MYKIIVIGAVKTTQITLELLMKHHMEVVGVMGYEPKSTELVSGWADLKHIANKYKLAYKGFSHINDLENIEWARDKNPDIIFAVGFSQLMDQAWLNMPTLGCIGFHPTFLPKGRGRAPIAWLVLENKEGAATFFLMGEGADDGPIFVQHKFEINSADDAETVEDKIGQSIREALDEWLPKLKKAEWNPKPQDELEATWYGKRGPEDGWIDWNLNSVDIDRLIKSSSKPHPGAYTYFKDQKVIIWKSQLEEELHMKGVAGRIVLKNDTNEYLIQCGDGLLWLRDLQYETETNLSVGQKLGYNIEDEIYLIKKLIKQIQK